MYFLSTIGKLAAAQLRTSQFSRVSVTLVSNQECRQVDHITLEPVEMPKEETQKNQKRQKTQHTQNLRASVLLELTEWVVQQIAQYHSVKANLPKRKTAREIHFPHSGHDRKEGSKSTQEDSLLSSDNNPPLSQSLLYSYLAPSTSSTRSVLSPKKTTHFLKNFGIPSGHPLPTKFLPIPVINGTLITLNSGLYRMYLNLKIPEIQSGNAGPNSSSSSAASSQNKSNKLADAAQFLPVLSRLVGGTFNFV